MQGDDRLSTSLGLLVLRLGTGLLLVGHSWPKAQAVMEGRSIEFLDVIGLGPQLSTYLATGAEVVGGLLVALGLATRLFAAIAAFDLGVAVFVVHLGRGQPVLQRMAEEGQGSAEMALLYFIPLLVLIFTGPGGLSLDAMISRRRR